MLFNKNGIKYRFTVVLFQKKCRKTIKNNKKIKIYIKYFTNIFYIDITVHYREKSRSAEADLTLEKGT